MTSGISAGFPIVTNLQPPGETGTQSTGPIRGRPVVGDHRGGCDLAGVGVDAVLRGAGPAAPRLQIPPRRGAAEVRRSGWRSPRRPARPGRRKSMTPPSCQVPCLAVATWPGSSISTTAPSRAARWGNTPDRLRSRRQRAVVMALVRSTRPATSSSRRSVDRSGGDPVVGTGRGVRGQRRDQTNMGNGETRGPSHPR